MTPDTPEANLDSLRRQIDDATKQYAALAMLPGESLHRFELRVKKCSDKLLALKVAEQTQSKLLEQEMRDKENDLKKTND